MTKRLFDLFASTCGLILLAPVLMVLALLIKLDTPGPVFFRQERVGRGGKLFRIHKFRTMVTDAELRGLQITAGFDARVTHVGQGLRKYKLDELPQLLDVWLGYMSLVGPRPEVPRYVAYYPADVRDVVLSVRPGITDRASIEFKDENEILGRADDAHLAYVNEVLPIKLTYYIEYVNTRSIIGDIKLIFITIMALVVGNPPQR
jgi:lipopolysaccharide/colanic/teichoic acid biosynthesis glycosyltransferase